MLEANLKLLTNIVVSHTDAAFLPNLEDCSVCIVKHIRVTEKQPFNFKMSESISESRAFFQMTPRMIGTKFVSFSSYRMAEKTNNKINVHSSCQFVQIMKPNDVIAPYTLKNSLQRMQNPTTDAPAYANFAAPIYDDVFKYSPFIKSLTRRLDSATELIFPFCNSFVMSKKTYIRFYFHLHRFAKRSWVDSGFHASWCENFSANFPNREYGMLFERFTALWIGLNPKYKVYSNGWGIEYPELLSNRNLSEHDWNSETGRIQLASLPMLQFN
jgi:hypothetical protein